MINKGKLVVFDGIDGTGKSTQIKLLEKRLKNLGFDVVVADFPQYGKKSAGPVEEYLNGKYGTADEVGPYRASIFYAVDRYDASFTIRQWLSEGKIILSNRYVTANMSHQGGKIKNNEKRKEFFSWLYNLEYEIFGLPKPDLNIILHIKAEIAQELVDKKNPRDYINGNKRDIHENDLEHLQAAEKIYSELSDFTDNVSYIECSKNDFLMTEEEISNLIWQKIVKILYIENRPSIKIKLLTPNSKLPDKDCENSPNLNLYACDYYAISPKQKVNIRTGIRIAMPINFTGLIYGLDVLAKNNIIIINNIISAENQDEIRVNIINLGSSTLVVTPGQKIAKLLIQKTESPKIIEN